MRTPITIASLLLLLLLLFGAQASAQTLPPYVHGGTLGTTQSVVVPYDPLSLRRKLIFLNPNASIAIAYCTVGPDRDTAQPVTCAINGPWSITLQPNQRFEITGWGVEITLPSAWYGVAASAGANYAVIEY
jgi:hypothetical protein